MKRSKTVEEFIESQQKWKIEINQLRRLLLETELEETIKWGMPVYTINDKNVIGLASFKSYVGLWFYHGSFLSDKEQVLINAKDEKTKGLRQLRFSSTSEIDYDLIKSYVAEAIQNQKDGKEIKPEKKDSTAMPDKLMDELEKDPRLKSAFLGLTPFKQTEYLEYIAEAKREETKQKRLEKIIPMILQCIGLNDKYR